MKQNVSFALNTTEILAGLCIVIGLGLVIFVPSEVSDTSFGQPYYEGARGIGWLLLLTGIVWLIFAELQLRLRFFDLNAPMEGQQAALSYSAAVVIAALSLILTLNNLPRTDTSSMTANQISQQQTRISQENALRSLVGTLLLLMSCGLFVFPVTKSLKKNQSAAS